LHSSPITEKGLIHLAALVNLNHLDLAESRVSDAGLACLANLPLETLKLAYPKINDAGLPHLHPLKTLRRHDLTRVPISKKGLAALQAALLDCDMTWWPPTSSAKKKKRQ
jgi:hypothetical protein